jgi:predicted DNA-binding ribbon-helix-helix protein
MPKRGKSSIVKRSVAISGRRATVSLEAQFWEALKEIAKDRGSTLQDLVTSINSNRREANLSSTIRLYVLGYYRDQIAVRTPRA